MEVKPDNESDDAGKKVLGFGPDFHSCCVAVGTEIDGHSGKQEIQYHHNCL